jgi:hypothetical protein
MEQHVSTRVENQGLVAERSHEFRFIVLGLAYQGKDIIVF